MAAAIDRYLGRERLRELVRLAPEDFVLDYIALSGTHGTDAGLVRLSPASIAAVKMSRAAYPPGRPGARARPRGPLPQVSRKHPSA